MHANGGSALPAFPSLFLIPDKIPYPYLLDIVKVLNHTHAIFGTVSLVKIPESLAWIPVTFVRTEFHLPIFKDRAISNYAFSAMARFNFIHLPATQASIPFPEIAQAYPTVHSARGNQVILHSSSSTDSFYRIFYVFNESILSAAG
jgi:hypothetical protein